MRLENPVIALGQDSQHHRCKLLASPCLQYLPAGAGDAHGSERSMLGLVIYTTARIIPTAAWIILSATWSIEGSLREAAGAV
jgi:hypothetical protein